MKKLIKTLAKKSTILLLTVAVLSSTYQLPAATEDYSVSVCCEIPDYGPIDIVD